MEEVREALWSIPQGGSPGPDGFSTSFFILAWEVVKQDILDMAKEFFDGIPLTTFFGTTNLVLIPKVGAPAGFGQFRPISLCSVVYKIMAKILVSRLAPVLEELFHQNKLVLFGGVASLMIWLLLRNLYMA